MFTNVKKFGSYVLTSENCFSNEVSDSNDTSLQVSLKCSIPSVWTDLTLVSIQPYNHDTSIFSFRLPDGCQFLNLPVGAFMLVLVPDSANVNQRGAVRPYTSVSDDGIANLNVKTGHFDLMCKRYDEWGKKETLQTHFLFTRTDHSYKPPGIVSNHIHSLKVGDTLKFKHNAKCQGRIHFPFIGSVTSLTMIAVGVGVAPMIHTLRAIFRQHDDNIATRDSGDNSDPKEEENGDSVEKDNNNRNRISNNNCITQIVLLYGVRTVADILMREVLEGWQEKYPHLFKVVYCVGSRWTNVHWGAKTKSNYEAPPTPEGFSDLKHAEQGWVNEEKIRKHGFPPEVSTRVLVCGLPGVYEQLCGKRDTEEITPCSVLDRIGYTKDMVIKL